MRSKTLISTIAAGLLAASLSSPALADGGRYHGNGGYRGHGGHGGHGGNNGAAVVAGVLGALVVGSIIANANAAPSYAPPQTYYQPPPAPTYYEAPRTYYQPAPPPQGYYQPAPVYQAQPATVVIESGYERPYWRERYQRHYYGY
jgi:hypothetical protein